MTRRDTERVLDAFVEGHLDGDDVSEWASAIEGRDDIGYERGFEGLLKELLFALATPELMSPLSREAAAEWKARLSV